MWGSIDVSYLIKWSYFTFLLFHKNLLFTFLLFRNQSWILTGRTHAEAKTPILWPPDVKNWLPDKDPDAGKDWGQEKKQTTEDEMVGWHHWLNGHDFVWTPGLDDGQGSLECCRPLGCKESDTPEWLNWLVKWLLCRCSGHVFSPIKWVWGGSFMKEIGL